MFIKRLCNRPDHVSLCSIKQKSRLNFHGRNIFYIVMNTRRGTQGSHFNIFGLKVVT